MKLTTAGESHGKALTGIIEGLPSNLEIDIDAVNRDLALRQSGYGRGGRQKIERDRIEILSGVRNRLTLGSPLCFAIVNADYKNWQQYMAPEGCDVTGRTLTKVRPGHADLTGMKKYCQSDARNILERASARETAVRVAAGSIAKCYLKALGVQVGGYVRCVCGAEDNNVYPFSALAAAKEQPLFMLNDKVQKQAMALIDSLKEQGDTAGGIVEIRINGLKSGFGSCMTYGEKLDARLAGALMGVQAIKGVEVGIGFEAGRLPGSKVHDEIFANGGTYVRNTNNAGGIEGGMSNGEDIVLRAVMKPIPTLMRGLKTVDTATGQPCTAAGERSDVAAICACEIILESVAAFTIAQAVSERLGGDDVKEVIKRYGELV
ncbi:MAG: chorismate synthase [Clostridia bacterium]|nr:chorismate synthase [Clostridia bacterium]